MRRLALILFGLVYVLPVFAQEGITNPQTNQSALTTNRGQLPGTITNNNASAGNVGEYIETIVTSASPVALTTATAANMGSVSLTAGDWDVTFVDEFGGNGATVVQSLVASVSLNSANLDNANGRASTGQYGTTIFGSATGFVTQVVPSVRISLSATTTVYGVCYATFTINTANCWGRISARRLR